MMALRVPDYVITADQQKLATPDSLCLMSGSAPEATDAPWNKQPSQRQISDPNSVAS